MRYFQDIKLTSELLADSGGIWYHARLLGNVNYVLNEPLKSQLLFPQLSPAKKYIFFYQDGIDCPWDFLKGIEIYDSHRRDEKIGRLFRDDFKINILGKKSNFRNPIDFQQLLVDPLYETILEVYTEDLMNRRKKN